MSPRIRNKKAGFVGLQLVGKDHDTTLFDRLEAYVKRTTLNRSQVLRLALIDFLNKEEEK